MVEHLYYHKGLLYTIELDDEDTPSFKKLEKINLAMGFIFSRSGFTKEAEVYCREKGIACSEDEKWIETGKLKLPVV